MTYYLSKAFWLLAAPTNALVLIGAIAGLWAVLGGSTYAAWVAVAAACGLVIGAFTPIGLALTVPLENRFPFSGLDLQVPPDGIIMLAGITDEAIDVASRLSQQYPKARLVFTGFGSPNTRLNKRFADLGGDPARISMVEPKSRTTFEDALYSAALLKPKSDERWLLITTAVHMPRSVGSFRVAGFQVEPYPVDSFTGGPSGPFLFDIGSSALFQFDRAVKEWIGLIAYRLMGKTDVLFPGPKPA